MADRAGLEPALPFGTLPLAREGITIDAIYPKSLVLSLGVEPRFHGPKPSVLPLNDERMVWMVGLEPTCRSDEF